MGQELTTPAAGDPQPNTDEASSKPARRTVDLRGETRERMSSPASLRELFDHHGGASGHIDVFRLEGFLADLLGGEQDGQEVLAQIVRRVHIDTRGRVSFEDLRRALVQIEQGDESPPLQPPKDAGHVFVLLADLRKVSCDCWVIPTGPTLVPDARWMIDPADFAGLAPELPGGARIRQVPNWPPTKPQAFVLNTHPPIQRSSTSSSLVQRPSSPMTGREPFRKMDLQWVHESLTLYLDTALRWVKERGNKPRNRRAKFLVCLPLLASKLAPQFSGQLIREILPLLYGFAVGTGIDVALCTIDKTVFAVMQAERARWGEMVAGMVWADLSSELLTEVEMLDRCTYTDKTRRQADRERRRHTGTDRRADRRT
jgi:hypothetical protein